MPYRFHCRWSLQASLLIGVWQIAAAAPPIITVHDSGFAQVEDAIPWLRRLGATDVILSRRLDETWMAAYEEAGFRTVSMLVKPKMMGWGAAPEDWIYSYLKSPWFRPDAGLLEIPINANYSERYVFAVDAPEDLRAFVQVKSDRSLVPRDQWIEDVDGGLVRILEPDSEDSYRLVFLAAEYRRGRKDNRVMHMDGTTPSGRKRHLELLGDAFRKTPSLSVYRPTTFVYNFSTIRPDSGSALGAEVQRSWYGYQRGMSPARILRFRERYGMPFDVRWITDTCYGDPSFMPNEGLLKWQALIQEEVVDYVRAVAALCHGNGKKMRMFWGDEWIGCEPYLGHLDVAGVDEVVTAMNGQRGLVRHLVETPTKAARIARFTWAPESIVPASSTDPETVRTCVNWIDSAWRRFRREFLFSCPDGLTFLQMNGAWASTAIGDEFIKVTSQYRQIHSLVHGQQPFRHTLNVCVLNAWGAARGWVKFATPSQRVFPGMVDWPVTISWCRFDDVIGNGVPEGTDVLVIAGEPNTAWSGGAYWKRPGLAGTIRRFVRGGGGLLCFGGAAVVDGRFALPDVLGVSVSGPANRWCAEQLWDLNRWIDAGYAARDWQRTTVFGTTRFSPVPDVCPEELGSRLGEDGFEAIFDTLAAPTEARPIFAGSAPGTGVFLNEYGQGRVIYSSGYPENDRVIRALVFYLAGRIEDFDRLTTSTPDVRSILYPDQHLWIVANDRGVETPVVLQFAPSLAGLANAETVTLAPVAGGDAMSVDADTLQTGWKITVPAGKIQFWRLSGD